jgi:phosphatidylinositol alpha-1,6-mannosyltransferase
MGNPICVVAPHQTDADLAFDQAQPFPIYRSLEKTFSARRHANRLRWLLRLCTEHKPHILWASDWRTGLTVALVAALRRKSFIVSAYGSELLLARNNRLTNLLATNVLKRAELVLSISHYTKQLLIQSGVPASKIAVIPLGVNPQDWQADIIRVNEIKSSYFLHDAAVILTLARLTPRKGHDVVIQALPQIKQTIPNVRYVIAGRGDDEARLRAMVEQLGLQSEVIFAGYVDESEKAAYYHACDVYTMLSRREGELVEGFGLTLLEAGACRKPVVAGRHGGVSDAVIEGETGLLVDPLDVDAVAEAIICLLKNREMAIQMGINAQNWIKREANWQHVATQTVALMSRRNH